MSAKKVKQEEVEEVEESIQEDVPSTACTDCNGTGLASRDALCGTCSGHGSVE